MKKYLYLAIVALLSAAVVSCGKDKNDPENGDNGNGETNNAYAITVSNIEATTASIAVVPTNKTATYYWSLLEKAEVDEIAAGTYAEEYEITDLASYATYVISYMVDLYSQYGYEITASDLLSTGDDDYDYDGLSPETEYTVYAVASDAEGVCSGKAATKNFTTGAVPVSNNQITMTYANGSININTTNSDNYIFIFETKADFDQYQTALNATTAASEAQAWIDAMNQYNMIEYFTKSGNESINVSEFWSTYLSEEAMASGEYVALAAPYAAAINGTVAYLLFTYEAPAAAPARHAAETNLIKKCAPTTFHMYKKF